MNKFEHIFSDHYQMSVAAGSPRCDVLWAYGNGDLSHDVIYLPHPSPFEQTDAYGNITLPQI